MKYLLYNHFDLTIRNILLEDSWIKVFVSGNMYSLYKRMTNPSVMVYNYRHKKYSVISAF